MVDAITMRDLFRRHVDVLERKLHAVVHLESTLALADQAELAVVDHDMDIRQLELRAHGHFFDHELEVVVARQRDDLARRVGLLST